MHVSMIMPYTWMVRIPLLSSFREADRFTELGLVAAALLAAAAVNWLRYHARPVLVVVLALGILEAGQRRRRRHPRRSPHHARPRCPRLTARSPPTIPSSIVVDIPLRRAQRRAAARRGSGFNPEAEVQATADGHPRSVAYISRLPESDAGRRQTAPVLRVTCSTPSKNPAPPPNLLGQPG